MRLSLLLVIFSLLSVHAEGIYTIDDSIQIGFGGNYAGISYAEDPSQFESSNDTSILSYSDGIYTLISTIDGSVHSSCRMNDIIYLGGLFEIVTPSFVTQNIVKYDIYANQFQSLEKGLNGTVHALFCDISDQIVYAGGDFTPFTGNTTGSNNVAAWNISANTWYELPWKGFNGPVYTITKNMKYNSLLFGGQFDATQDGMYMNTNKSQPVDMGSRTSISSGNGALSGIYSDPNSIICPNKRSANETDAPWFLQEGVPGYWDANFANPIKPSLFRLSNIQIGDRRTVSFNILSMPSNQYLELTYVDPVTQLVTQCSTECTLSTELYQDFTVNNPILSNGIRININSWIGSGGGLNFVQIFQSDLSLYPSINNGNECNPSAYSTRTTAYGVWDDVYVFGYYQTVLTSSIPVAEIASSNTSIVYEPYIPVQGQYEVFVTTPGCVGSSDCSQRTQVEYLLQFSPDTPPITIASDQNTYMDRRVVLYSGPISRVSDTFRPSLTLRLAVDSIQSLDREYVVMIADSIEFIRNTTAPPLISILEYMPSSNEDVSWKPLNVSYDYLRGQILPLGGNMTGLNGKVSKLHDLKYNSIVLYVGGEYNTTINSIPASNIAQYDVNKREWRTLGYGVDGPITKMSLLQDGSLLTLSGLFHNRYIDNSTLTNSRGNSQWSILDQTWKERPSFLVGEIELDEYVTETKRIIAGKILGAQTYRADMISPLDNPYLLDNSFYTVNHVNTTIITAGVLWECNENSINCNQTHTIVAGHFQNDPSMNISTVAIINNNHKTVITELKGEVYSLAIYENLLFVGGHFEASEGQSLSASLAVYDLNDSYRNIRIQGVSVAGKFTNVGLLECGAICFINPTTFQWNKELPDLSGIVHDVLTSVINEEKKITVIGDLRVNNQMTTIATIVTNRISWSVMPGVVSEIPFSGVYGNQNELYLAGTSDRPMSSYVMSFGNEEIKLLNYNLKGNSVINQLAMVPASSTNKKKKRSLEEESMLIAIGHLQIEDFGTVSAALFDGELWHPFLLTTQFNGQAGIINTLILPTNFNDALGPPRKHIR
ncbi:cortical protein marker for cell polarity-domain-containing protein [Pilobolus umbonatus]|nr:cortical protein marker for cell polarity-domain-containing protein [Pilobolus umbonatus]